MIYMFFINMRIILINEWILKSGDIMVNLYGVHGGGSAEFLKKNQHLLMWNDNSGFQRL